MGRFIIDETRRRLATGWDPRVCTLREYARQNGVSERAVRLWRARLRHDGGISVPGGRDDVPLHVVMDALQARLHDLEAAVDAALAAAGAARAALDAVADVGRPAGMEAAPDVEPTKPAPVVERMPMPPPGSTWF